MNILHTRPIQRWTTIALSAVLAISALPPAAPANAQEGDPVIAFADGEWLAVLNSNSQVSPGAVVVTAGTSGTATFTSDLGSLDGAWQLEGSGTMSGEVSGTAEYVAEGQVTGSADNPRFISTSNHIHLVAMLETGPFETDMDMPGGESFISLTLTHATCSQVVGEWEVSSPPVTASGAFVAVRVSNLHASTAPDFETRVTDLMVDAMEFRDAAIASGRLAPGGLEALLARAQELDRALTDARDCSATPTDEDYMFHNLIAGVVADLVQFALDNPLLLTSSDMRILVTALFSTGAYNLIGEDAIAGLHGLVGANMDAAIASGDPIAISNMVAAAAMLGAWDLVAVGEAALGDE